MNWERFWSKVDKGGPGGCWLWTGALNPRNGYAQFSWGGRGGPRAYVHRLAHEYCLGPIAEGLEVDHLCGVRHCVNPDHLEAVDHRTNCLRSRSWVAVNASKTHCPQGHPYDDENTVIGNKGERRCRTCVNERAKRWRERQREAA